MIIDQQDRDGCKNGQVIDIDVVLLRIYNNQTKNLIVAGPSQCRS